MSIKRFKDVLLLTLAIALLIAPAISLLSANQASATLGGLNPHHPIRIRSDNDFTPANGVTSGSGTADDPYIIENWAINAYDEGIWISMTSAHFVIRNCLIENGGSFNPGIFLTLITNGKVKNCVIRNNMDGISLVDSNNITIENCTITLNRYKISFGIDFIDSHNNIIVNNNLDSNRCGIFLHTWSENNLIVNNNITNNEKCGIYISASNNYIYHNNFVNNTTQAHDDGTNTWDNGYPSGGNYWSDYPGVDADNDGIGDTPYDILGGNNQDRYPFTRAGAREGLPLTWISVGIVVIIIIAIIAVIAAHRR